MTKLDLNNYHKVLVELSGGVESSSGVYIDTNKGRKFKPSNKDEEVMFNRKKRDLFINEVKSRLIEDNISMGCGKIGKTAIRLSYKLGP